MLDTTSSRGAGGDGVAPSRPVAFVAAIAIAAAVLLLRWTLDPLLEDQAPFLVLLIAPVIAAAWFGFGPGLVATVVCTIAGTMLFIEPIGSVLPPVAAEWARLRFFLMEGALFSWLFDERRRALAAVQQRERRFRDAIEAAPSGMILADAEGRISYANARARAWFGYAAHEFRNLSIEDLVPLSLRDSHRRDRAEFARRPAPRAMGAGRELRARRKDGSEFPIEIGLSPVPAEGESLVIAAVVDVTARQKALARLVEGERRQRFLLALTERLQGLSDPAAMMDAATRALGEHLGVAQVGYGEVDDASEHVSVSRDWNDGRIASVVGRWWMRAFGADFVHDMKAGRSVVVADVGLDPRTNAPETRRAYEAITTRAFVDVPLVRDGRLVAMLFVNHPEPRPWADADVLLAEETCARLWTAVERVRAERRARVSLELLDRAGAAARVGAFIDTIEGPASMRWSDRLFDIMGMPRGETPTLAQVLERFPPAVRGILREAMIRTTREGVPLEIELPLLPRANAASWVRIYAAPTMQAGRCVEISGAMQDISDRKQLELDVVAATNQERERIGEDLHDDLGQVLTAVTLQVGAFRRTLGQELPVEARRRDIEDIERNLEHARTVCRRLARTYVAPVSPMSFLAMLRQLARDVTGDRQCIVRGSELPATTPPAMAQELYRITQEAVNNALKHSRCRQILLEVQVDPARLTLAIEDDGIGLPKGGESTGIGLASMRSRAARIGGIITLGSGANGGTRIVVTCARPDASPV